MTGAAVVIGITGVIFMVLISWFRFRMRARAITRGSRAALRKDTSRDAVWTRFPR